MTPEAARALADRYQERCDQMGPDHPETGRLGPLVSCIRDLANQVDALTVGPEPVEAEPEPVDATPPKRKR